MPRNVVAVPRGGVMGGAGDKIKVSRPLFKIVFLSRARTAVAVLAGSVASTERLNYCLPRDSTDSLCLWASPAPECLADASVRLGGRAPSRACFCSRNASSDGVGRARGPTDNPCG